jgi:hypothetical protein
VVLAAIETGVWIALIGAATSLATAILAQVSSRRTSARVAKLEEERAERDARRDYEYEARKRLYEECEPLLFQALELASTAQSRVISIARTARSGHLRPDGSGWLAGDGYYLKSTTYLLLAPVTSFRLLQGRLTGIDLGLDPRLRTQYELLKLLFLSFNADFDLARCAPRALPYEPDSTDPGAPGRGRLLAQDPARYARQGLYRGILDVTVEALIAGEEDPPRCLTVGEFLRDWEAKESALYGLRGELQALIGGFHPARKPVLWRVLVSQHLLTTLLLRDRPLDDAPLPELELAPFDWRHGEDIADDDVREPLRAAHGFVAAKLEDVRSRLGVTTG